MSNTYFQVPIEEKSKRLTTIITEEGTFYCNCTPFRIKTAPACFQIILSETTREMPGVLNYLVELQKPLKAMKYKPKLWLFKKYFYNSHVV